MGRAQEGASLPIVWAQVANQTGGSTAYLAGSLLLPSAGQSFSVVLAVDGLEPVQHNIIRTFLLYFNITTYTYRYACIFSCKNIKGEVYVRYEKDYHMRGLYYMLVKGQQRHPWTEPWTCLFFFGHHVNPNRIDWDWRIVR